MSSGRRSRPASSTCRVIGADQRDDLARIDLDRNAATDRQLATGELKIVGGKERAPGRLMIPARFEFKIPKRTRRKMIGISNSPHWLSAGPAQRQQGDVIRTRRIPDEILDCRRDRLNGRRGTDSPKRWHPVPRPACWGRALVCEASTSVRQVSRRAETRLRATIKLLPQRYV